MIRRPPRSTRTDTLFPYTTLFRSLLSGTGKDDVHLLVVITSDRGLCGSFNVNIMRGVRQRVRALEAEGKTVKIYGVGRKGIMLARREYRSKVVEALEDASKPVPSFEKAAEIDRTSVVEGKSVSVRVGLGGRR